jgi:hypothetical protein
MYGNVSKSAKKYDYAMILQRYRIMVLACAANKEHGRERVVTQVDKEQED